MNGLRVIVLGLSLSSSWGNGHATTFRALLKAFAARGHDVLFLERDVPWYAVHRDLADPDFCRLEFYSSVGDLERYRGLIADADAVVVGSYVPDGVEAGRWVQRNARGVVAFYDIDTPVTLAKLERGDYEYLSPQLIPDYDVYFSFTGGPTLDLLMDRYGSPAARALYCSVDPELYPALDRSKLWDLSYLGTYSPDRQPTLERLLIEPARRAPHLSFVVAGPQYPAGIDWPANVERIDHVPPSEHPAFYAQSRFTLNVTRADMILAPGREILLAQSPDDVLGVLGTWPEARRNALGEAAHRRILSEHTAAHRAGALESGLREAIGRPRKEYRLAMEIGV